jgi:hypothetical protein
MAKKISELALAASVAGGDAFEVLQGGLSKRAPLNVPWTFGSSVVIGADPGGTRALRVGGQVRAKGSGGISGAAHLLETDVKNTIGLHVGLGAGYISGDVGGAIRMDGSGTLWGDILWMPSDNRFVLSSTGAVFTTTANAQLEVGSLRFGADNAQDIGAAGANRPRTLYIGTSVIVAGGTLTLTNGVVTGSVACQVIATTGDVALDAQAPGNLIFRTAATQRWIIQTDGHFRAPSGQDNTYDIGTAALRPRTIYAATSVVTPVVTGPSGDVPLSLRSVGTLAQVQLAPNGIARWNAANTKEFLPNTDNDSDLGIAVTNRVRTGYFGTSVVTPGIDSGTTGNINLSTTGGLQATIAHIASAVNFLRIQGAATGGNVGIRSQGSDTDVAMEMSSQGADSIRFSTNSFGQLQVEILHTASATRAITLTGSNGGNPVIDVSAGALKLSAGTSDIQWGKANVALGGGAAPTVGTIGGSGPAAAAQRNWLRLLESDGTASFIPVWR